MEDEADGLGFLGIHKKGSEFGLGGGCGDEIEDTAHDVYGSIYPDQFVVSWYVTQEEEPARMAVQLGGGQVGSV